MSNKNKPLKITINKTYIFRYIKTFSITLLLLFILLFISQLIPHKYIEKNTIKSAKELTEIFKNEKSKHPNSIYEKIGDVRLLGIIFSEDEKHPLKSLIEMNYYENCDKQFIHCSEVLKEKKGKLIEYSRYWHGQTIFEKILLVFTTIKTINNINLLLITLLLILTTIKLFKKDKVLSIIFLVTLLSTNIFFTTSSMQYVMVMYIVLITTNLLITMINKNSKNIDLLFLITGMCTCFLDFLTAETLTLTLPLLIYIFLQQKQNDINYRKIIQLILLWTMGYSLTFISKWIISYIHYGPKYLNTLFNHAMIRINDEKDNINIIQKTIALFAQIIPFNYLKNGGMIGILLLLITFIYNFLYNKKNVIAYCIILIPIFRILFLKTHTLSFYYFTYRAFSIILYLILCTIFDIVKSIIGGKP